MSTQCHSEKITYDKICKIIDGILESSIKFL